MSHLNAKTMSQSASGKIMKKELIHSAVRFHLQDGSQATYSQYFFDNIISLENIGVGDSISKKDGSLELEVYVDSDLYVVSLAR